MIARGLGCNLTNSKNNSQTQAINKHWSTDLPPVTSFDPQPQTPNFSQATNEAQEKPKTDPMAEYYQLKQQLLLVTIALTAGIFIGVWLIYDLNIALNYLIGAGTGLVYLRMLSKKVETLGNGTSKVSSSRIALIAIPIIVASQWEQLQILPIFLGFLTYKVAIMIYTLQTSFGSIKSKS
jgi:ATP synthase protein I